MHEAPELLFLKEQHYKRAQHKAATQRHSAQLPRNLPLSAPREHPLHNAQDVEARDQIEGLEDDVPCRVRLIGVEEIEVARAEDARIEDLRDQRHALRRPIAVNGEDQDEFGEDVGDVSQVAEELSDVSKAVGIGWAWPRGDERSTWLQRGLGIARTNEKQLEAEEKDAHCLR